MSRVAITFVAHRVSTLGVIRPASAASVTIFDRGTANETTVYTTPAGAVEIPQPLAADAYGRVVGWVEAAKYDISVSGTGFSTYSVSWDAVSEDHTHPQDDVTGLVAALSAKAAQADFDTLEARADVLESNGGPAKLGADNKFLGNGASDAEFRALYGEPGSPPLDSPTISVQKADATASTQHGGAFFGVISAAGSLSAANNVGVYGFAEEDRVSPTGGTWGANFGARADATGPANVQGCEVDIVNNVAHSGTTASGALGVLGLSIASGGPFRPLVALDIATNAAPFQYGIRFAEGAVYNLGAVVQSLTTDPTQIQWEVFDYDAASGYSNPLFKFNASGKMSWGAGGASAVDTTMERASIIAGQSGLKVGAAFEIVAGAKICSFSAGQTLSFFGAAGATQATITGSRGGATVAVLTALLAALGNHGLITDSTTA